MDLIFFTIVLVTATGISFALIALREYTAELKTKMAKEIAAIQNDKVKAENTAIAAKEQASSLSQQLKEMCEKLNATRTALEGAKATAEHYRLSYDELCCAHVTNQEKLEAALDGVKIISSSGDIYLSDDGTRYALYRCGDEFRIISKRGPASIVPANKILLEHDYVFSGECTNNTVWHRIEKEYHKLRYRVYYGTAGAEFFDVTEINSGIGLIITGILNGVMAGWEDIYKSRERWDQDIQMAFIKIKKVVAAFLQSKGLRLVDVVAASD